MTMLSQLLYCLLDHLGYNNDMVKFRRELWKCFAELMNRHGNVNDKLDVIIAGSKAEGITSFFESDIDILFISRSLYCIEQGDVESLAVLSQQPNGTVFETVTDNVPSGYTKLQLYSSWESYDLESEERYLSSKEFTTLFEYVQITSGLLDNTVANGISGPALSFTAKQFINFDTVAGFKLLSPCLLDQWARRPRHHEWPSSDTITKACSYNPQVVPVGDKGSDEHFLEWRFCFIESELVLTHSFNETQNKLYILLKMIAKYILKTVDGEISSYIMKNITYWISELLPLKVFRADKLIPLVLLALRFLKLAITNRLNLPYYMIPSRNLLSGRLDIDTQGRLSGLLDTLLQEGPQLFLRVDKLRIALHVACKTPLNIVRYGKMRDQMEKMKLVFVLISQLDEYGPHKISCKGELDTQTKRAFKIAIWHMCLLYPGKYDDDFIQVQVNILS